MIIKCEYCQESFQFETDRESWSMTEGFDSNDYIEDCPNCKFKIIIKTFAGHS